MFIAHQGGWDEMLFVAIPIALFALLLYLANRRAKASIDQDDAADTADDEQP
jgi:hypothetical protein